MYTTQKDRVFSSFILVIDSGKNPQFLNSRFNQFRGIVGIDVLDGIEPS